jgi:hypothetical protein
VRLRASISASDSRSRPAWRIAEVATSALSMRDIIGPRAAAGTRAKHASAPCVASSTRPYHPLHAPRDRRVLAPARRVPARFDFDGATFTHVGDRVTFQTLQASYGLDGDPALARLGQLVHHLDVGGEPVPEASGFEAVMTGARERLDDDDALLAEMSAVLDSLYTHYTRQARAPA